MREVPLPAESAPAGPSSLESLRAEISTLEQHLSSLTAEETEAQEQLGSLTYALQLTRGEARRRQRSNTELHTAYQGGEGGLRTEHGDENEEGKTSREKLNDAQHLESELLNAKRDAAKLVYEVEQLEFSVRSAKRRDVGVVVTPMSPTLHSTQGMGVSTTSPSGRTQRLIGDVDAIAYVGEMGASLEGSSMGGRGAGCRLGVSAGRTLGLYSYGSAEVVLDVSARGKKVEDVGESDGRMNTICAELMCIDLQIGGRSYAAVGLAESVSASKHLIRGCGGGGGGK